jgi:RES domain-containing protein
VRERPTIVRPLDTPRLAAAERGVSAKMGEVLNRAGARWEPRLLANLYAAAALEADDAHGAEHDLLTQHHKIVRADLAAVLGLAAEALDGQHAVPGKLHRGCPQCDAVFALGRVRNALDWTASPQTQANPD